MMWLVRIWGRWSKWVAIGIVALSAMAGIRWRIRKGAKNEVRREVREANMRAYLEGEEAERNARESIADLTYDELVERMREAGDYR